jgi:uncharacterized damage-inducible protein DinB
MKKIFSSIAVLTLAFSLAASPARAQDTKAAEAKPATGVRAEILRQIEDAQKKLLALAEATPADKFGWRPAEGVRTTGEVYAHVAGGNMFLPTFWGAKLPEGVNPREFEKQGGDKAKTIDTLKKSFDHVHQVIAAVPDSDLDRNVKFFGQEGSVRTVMMILASHAHEHLGQAIAYARMGGIVPPWSGGGQ